jgi:hypothetical protein
MLEIKKLEARGLKKCSNPPQNFRTATLKRPKIGDEDFSKNDFWIYFTILMILFSAL